MRNSAKKIIKNGINSLIGRTGFELVHSMRADRPQEDYIPFSYTLAEAKKANLSVSDYIDQQYAGVGATPKTIQTLVELGVLNPSVKRIAEIGPGSGRYLEKVMKICQPDYYEIYETAVDWLNYLVATYKVVAQPCDSWYMSATPSESLDLVHANRVYTSIPAMMSFSYILEMARVVRKGGRVVFDIFSEECMDEQVILKTIATKTIHPHIFPRKLVIDLLADHGLTLEHSFYIDLVPGKTEYLVFLK